MYLFCTLGTNVYHSKTPLNKVEIIVSGSSQKVTTSKEGVFSLSVSKKGDYLLRITKQGYEVTNLPVTVEGTITELGNITLKEDLSQESDYLVLSDSEIENDESSADRGSVLLQSSKDIFMRRAAFDFGQVFFKPRGYDSNSTTFSMNGITMNKFQTGRPQWSDWGGLNDVIRNQQISVGITSSDYNFGGLFGSTYLDLHPSLNRRGLRLSASGSNRSYKGRLMATYNSGAKTNGIAFTVSGSRRWSAHSGYFDGTTYNALSLYGSAEYKFDPHNSIMATAMFAPNRRGKGAVVTQEVTDLAGFRYNPYWGWQNNEKRNSRMKKIIEPLFLLSYEYKKDNTLLSATLGYQTGKISNSRIQYGNGQNPEPNYYKNLPSYYINAPQGADWKTAALQKEYFLKHQQLDWAALYRANMSTPNGESIYIISKDINQDNTLSGNINFSTKFNEHIQLNAGINYQNIKSENYAKIDDLLGGSYFVNKSYFTGKTYDANSDLKKSIGDKFQYDYFMYANLAKAFAQLRFQYGKFDIYAGTSYQYTKYQREGIFDNKAFKKSEGKSQTQEFYGLNGKVGLTYAITGRHLLQANAAYFTLPQKGKNLFANVRNSNILIPDMDNETQYTADASYLIRMPYFKMRLTGYFTQMENASETNFFFTQAAITDEVSSDFLNVTTVGIDKRHFGVEFGAEAQILPTVKATAVAAIGQYTYNNNPKLYLASDDIAILEIKKSYLKNYKISSGPQHAYSVGLEYNSPKYWWAGITANFLTHNYVSVSHLYRTENFFKDPKTNSFFNNINMEKARELLTQEKLPNLFLMNFTAGKSWRVNHKYISLFVSINNLLDKKFYSGGFEQTRKASYEGLLRDKANGVPTFGPRYFKGYGRTLFINLAVSL